MVRPATFDDFTFIHDLYFHPQINPFLLYEMAESAHFSAIFAELMSKNVLFVFETDGEKVGMFKLVPLTFRTSHIAYLGGVAIDLRFSGQGFGRKMMEQIVALGGERGLRRIELSTATINEKAIHVYGKVGFEKEGILRNYTFLKTENQFLDEVIMSYLY